MDINYSPLSFEIPLGLLTAGDKVIIGKIGEMGKQYVVTACNDKYGTFTVVGEELVWNGEYGRRETIGFQADIIENIDGKICAVYNKHFHVRHITFFAIPSKLVHYGRVPSNVLITTMGALLEVPEKVTNEPEYVSHIEVNMIPPEVKKETSIDFLFRKEFTVGAFIHMVANGVSFTARVLSIEGFYNDLGDYIKLLAVNSETGVKSPYGFLCKVVSAGQEYDTREVFKSIGITYFSVIGSKFYYGTLPNIGFKGYCANSAASNSLSTSNMDLMRKYKDSKMSTQDRAFIKAGVTDREGNLRERGALDFTEWLFNEGTVKQGAKEVKLKDLFFEQVVGPALSEEESVDED